MPSSPTLTLLDCPGGIATTAAPNELPRMRIVTEVPANPASVRYRVAGANDPAITVGGPYATAIGTVDVDLRSLLSRRFGGRIAPPAMTFAPAAGAAAQTVLDTTAQLSFKTFGTAVEVEPDGRKSLSDSGESPPCTMLDTDVDAATLNAAPLTLLSPYGASVTMPRVDVYVSVFVSGTDPAALAWTYSDGSFVSTGTLEGKGIHVVKIPATQAADGSEPRDVLVLLPDGGLLIKYDDSVPHVVFGLSPRGGWVQCAFNRRDFIPSTPAAAGSYAYPRPLDRVAPYRPGQPTPSVAVLTRSRVPTAEFAAYRELLSARALVAYNADGVLTACDIQAVGDLEATGSASLTLAFRANHTYTP